MREMICLSLLDQTDQNQKKRGFSFQSNYGQIIFYFNLKIKVQNN